MIRTKMGVMDKLHNIVVHIRASPKRTKEFEAIAGKSIPLDNRTRWNSWFRMLHVALGTKVLLMRFEITIISRCRVSPCPRPGHSVAPSVLLCHGGCSSPRKLFSAGTYSPLRKLFFTPKVILHSAELFSARTFSQPWKLFSAPDAILRRKLISTPEVVLLPGSPTERARGLGEPDQPHHHPWCRLAEPMALHTRNW